MSNAIIRQALEGRLKAWADAQIPKIPIAFEERPFKKPEDSVWLEPILIPNVTLNPNTDGLRKRLLGIFQVNCWAKSGKTMHDVEQLAQNIVNLFPILPKTGVVSIEKTPHVEGAISDTSSGWVIVPVTIMYRAEFV